jgi:acetylglutamate kinase
MVVLKLGGTSLAEQGQVLGEVAAVARRRPVVIVHGGGKRITAWLERLGVPTRFEAGLRVTDAAAIEVAAAVLRGVVNSELVTALHDVGVNAVGLSGVDGGLLVGERVAGLGLVAHVVGVRRDLIDAILVGGQVPVVAGLGARQLILMTDVDGIRGAGGAKLGTLSTAEAEALIAAGTINGGMVPKVRAALAGIGAPGAEAVICNAAAPQALARALDDPTFGTRISRAPG